jgi:hypothetical protein
MTISPHYLLPPLPKDLEDLADLALDLRWSWVSFPARAFLPWTALGAVRELSCPQTPRPGWMLESGRNMIIRNKKGRSRRMMTSEKT